MPCYFCCIVCLIRLIDWRKQAFCKTKNTNSLSKNAVAQKVHTYLKQMDNSGRTDIIRNHLHVIYHPMLMWRLLWYSLITTIDKLLLYLNYLLNYNVIIEPVNLKF